MRHLAPFLLLTITLLVVSASPAAAQQHQHANVYQHWTVDPTRWNVEMNQRIVPGVISPYSFFSLVGGFGNTGDGFYLGVQQDGTSAWNRKVRFSVWGSTAFWPAAGGSTCRPFDGEGIGQTCERSFGYVQGRHYNLRMRLLSNLSDPAGLWWNVTIRDLTTGVTYDVGSIRAVRGAGFINRASNFNEYYGPAVACSRVPTSDFIAYPPSFNGDWTSGYNGSSVASCSGGRVSQGFGVSVLQLGVR